MVGKGHLQHLVAPGPHAGDGGVDFNVGSEADALKLAAVGVEHSLAGERNSDTARDDELGYITVGTG
jgi:hypothetical protein